MDLLQASRNQLINEVYESKKLLFRLINLPEDMRSKISPLLLPYLTMICYGLDSLFQDENSNGISSKFDDINGVTFSRLIKQIRASSKLLTDQKNLNISIKKANSETSKVQDELMEEYNKVQQAYVKFFGQKDLGVYYYKGKPFANSSQISLYIKPLNSDINNIGKYLEKFSMQIANYINIFSTQFEENTLSRLKQEDYRITNIELGDLISKDYNYGDEKYRTIFNNVINKKVSLYLFNMQCQLNFALNILKLLIDEHPLKYRIQLLIYYYSVQAIDFAFQSGYLGKAENSHEKIVGLIDTNNQIFKDNTLRNNLFHYKLSEEINPNLGKNYFEAMVESLTSVSLKHLLTTVYKEMEVAENLIKELIY